MRIKIRPIVTRYRAGALVGLILGLADLACALPMVGGAGPASAQTEVALAVAVTLTADAAHPSVQSPTLPASDEPQPADPMTPAGPTLTPTATATATDLPVPTAAPPFSATFPDGVYVLAEERVFGEYAVRVWENTNSPSDMGFDRLATIEQAGADPITLEFFSSLHELTGTDINRDGLPEVVLETFTGGAHCCFATVVVSLGERATKIMETRPSNCSGRFTDLDGDGDREFVTCDDIFAYTYCSYAASPIVAAVLTFRPGSGYVAANPEYGAIYQADLERYRLQAETGLPGELGEWDGSNKCSVLPYILALYYSGQAETAWSELARVYSQADRDTWRSEIEATAAGSDLYAAP